MWALGESLSTGTFSEVVFAGIYLPHLLEVLPPTDFLGLVEPRLLCWKFLGRLTCLILNLLPSENYECDKALCTFYELAIEGILMSSCALLVLIWFVLSITPLPFLVATTACSNIGVIADPLLPKADLSLVLTEVKFGFKLKFCIVLFISVFPYGAPRPAKWFALFILCTS